MPAFFDDARGLMPWWCARNERRALGDAIYVETGPDGYSRTPLRSRS
jgi:hypothetical protein